MDEIKIRDSKTFIIIENKKLALCFSSSIVTEKDREQCQRGEWDNYEDVTVWKDELSGYYCMIKLQYKMTLCGYVFIDKNNKFYDNRIKWNSDNQCIDKTGQYLDFLRSLECHGGVTFIGKLSDLVVTDSDMYAVGFDCSHAWDFSPWTHTNNFNFHDHSVYRSLEYVKQECSNLARQIYEASNLDANKKNEDEFIYSTCEDEGSYCYEKSDILSELEDDDRLIEGQVYYKSKKIIVNPRVFLNVENIVEQMEESAYDYFPATIGNEDLILFKKVSSKDKEDLKDVIIKFLTERNLLIPVFEIGDTEEVKVTKEDIESMS